MLHRFAFACLALCSTLAARADIAPATGPASAPATLPAGRVEMRVEDLTIEHAPEDEPFARAFATWIVEARTAYFKRLDDGARVYATLIETTREGDLKFIAEQLALDRPTDEMTKLYDSVAVRVPALIKPALRFDRVIIWRAPNLQQRLKAGEKLPPFTLDEGGKITYGWNFNISINIDEKLPTTQQAGLKQFVLPVMIKEDDLRRDDRDIERHKQDAMKMLAGLAQPKSTYGRIGETMSLVSLHEATEAALLRHYLKSKDRRWFLEGVANQVAFTRLRYKMGSQAADALYRGIYSPEKYSKWLGRVDLDRWPTVENQDASSPKGDFLHAHYYLATETIRAAVDYHGPDLLPKVLKELKTVPPDRATIADVYAAFTRVTGDDLHKLVDRTRDRLLRASDNVPAPPTTKPATAPVVP